MIDRAIEGFRQGSRIEGTDHEAQRDHERRWHNLMKPFDQLKDAEKLSDLALLRTLLDRPADLKAPIAHWRKVAQISLDFPEQTKGAPLTEATELEVTIEASPEASNAEALEASEQVVIDWSKGDQACRLHFRLATPVRGLKTTPGTRSSSILRAIRDLLTRPFLAGLTIDITRLRHG